MLTDKGRDERAWQIAEVRKIFESACEWDRARIARGGIIDPDDELDAMKRVNQNPPELIGRKRKKRGQTAAA